MNTNPVKKAFTSITLNYHKTASSSITDLTGTKWLFNSSLNVPSSFDASPFSIDFVSNSLTFSRIRWEILATTRMYYVPSGNGTGTSVYSNSWSNEAYRTIEITGGSDATNATLISWLQSNATQIEDEDPEPEPEPTPEPASEKLITLDNLAVFKEEEDALLAGKMANPMTTAGDIVVGGASGTPARLAKGTAGQVLTMNSGATAPEWTTPSVGLPTIAVTQSQVISQDPLQFQLTDEQYTATNGRSVIFDGTNLGMTAIVADYIGSYTDNDIRYLKFAFVYSEDSDYLYFHTIFVNTSTKVAELQFNNTFPAKANYAYSADVTLDKYDVGLGNVDNTSDLNKPISTATQTALNLKADKATTYTKTETDTLLGAKANSADVYTKTAADSLLSAKANSVDVYTKAQVDSAIATAVTGAINASY